MSDASASLAPLDSARLSPWPSRRRQLSDWLGIGGLALFSGFALLGISGAYLGLSLMLLALLIAPRAWVGLLRQPLVWLSLLCMAYIGWRALIATSEFPPPLRDAILEESLNWCLLCLFFLPGWWMSASRRRVLLAFGLMLGGFLLGALLALDSTTLQYILHGGRSGLHFGKPIIFGFHCAVGLLAMVALIQALRVGEHQHSAPRRRRWLWMALAGGALLLFLQGLILSQSRGVWLAFVPALALTWFLSRDRSRQAPIEHRRRSALIAGALMLLILLPTLALHWHSIGERLAFEQHELSVVLTQGLDEAPLTSSTYRLHLWRFGLDTWLEQPLLGRGPGSSQILIEQAKRPELTNPESGLGYDHLHNAYLELLNQLGLVGLTLVLAIIGVLLKTCLQAHRNGQLSRPLFAFLCGNLILIAIYSLTDFRHLHWNWQFYWLILAGAIFSLDARIKAPREFRTDAENPTCAKPLYPGHGVEGDES